MNVLYELDGRVILSSVLYENRIILIIFLFINWWIYNVINYSYMNFILFEKSIYFNFIWNLFYMIFYKNFFYKFFVFSIIIKYKIMLYVFKLKFIFCEIYILFFYVIYFVMLKC